MIKILSVSAPGVGKAVSPGGGSGNAADRSNRRHTDNSPRGDAPGLSVRMHAFLPSALADWLEESGNLKVQHNLPAAAKRSGRVKPHEPTRFSCQIPAICLCLRGKLSYA